MSFIYLASPPFLPGVETQPQRLGGETYGALALLGSGWAVLAIKPALVEAVRTRPAHLGVEANLLKVLALGPHVHLEALVLVRSG